MNGAVTTVLLVEDDPAAAGPIGHELARTDAQPSCPNALIVVPRGSTDEEAACLAVHRGALDYLVKGHGVGHWLRFCKPSNAKWDKVSISVARCPPRLSSCC